MRPISGSVDTDLRSNNYFNGDALGWLGGYLIGRVREDASGDSVISGKVAKDTRCVVRINRRILFQ